MNCRRIGIVLGSLLLAACGAGWQRIELGPSNYVDPKQVVEIWSGAHREQWHGVWLTADSIGGIPYLQRLDCDSCHRAVARAAVDSLRCGDPVTPGEIAGLAPVLALLAMGLFVHFSGGLK